MTENSSRVIVARPADMEPSINVMVLAFAADAVARWMYRDPQRYLARFGRFIKAFAGKAFSIETAWCIDGNLGAALWLPAGEKPDQEAIVAILDESVPRDVMADVNVMFGEMASYHPRDLHWYLPTIGVEPHLHRSGLGSALLAETLRRCDQEHLPAYLESNTPPTPRCTRGSGSRRWASYVWATRRPCSRCCGLRDNPNYRSRSRFAAPGRRAQWGRAIPTQPFRMIIFSE